MSVVIVYDHFIALGGAENVSLQLARELKDAQIECAYVDDVLFGTEVQKGIIKSSGFKPKVGPINSLYLLIFYLFRYRLPVRKKVILSGLFAPLSLLRKHKCQKSIIYFHMFPVFLSWSFKELQQRYGLIVAIFSLPVIVAFRGLLKKAVKRADKVFSNAKQAKRKFSQIGIETELLYPPVSISGFSYNGDSKFFLSTARLESSKRVDTIAEAFSSLPHLKIIFVGGGSLLSELRHRYRQFPNIQFVGWTALDEVKSYYSEAKCLIYIPENEAFGIAPIEALAAGKPVLAVAEAGLLETINDSRLGYLLDLPVTTEKLKNAIILLEKSKDTPEAVSYRKSYASQFDAKLFYSKIISVLEMNDEKPVVV